MSGKKRFAVNFLLFFLIIVSLKLQPAHGDWMLIDNYTKSWPNTADTFNCTHYLWNVYQTRCENVETHGNLLYTYINIEAACEDFGAPYLGGCTPEPFFEAHPGASVKGPVLFTALMRIEAWMPDTEVIDLNPASEGTFCPINIHEPKTKVSNPIDILSAYQEEFATDLEFSTPFEKGFSFYRTYNSRSISDSTIGFGWHFNYHVTLEYYPHSFLILLKDESNRLRQFRDEDGDGTFTPDIDAVGNIIAEPGGGFTWQRGNGIEYTFNNQYQFVAKTDGHGNVQTLAYDDVGRLQTVTDEATGRSLTIAYSTEGKIDHIAGPVTEGVPDGIWVRYGYDGNNNLIHVEYADDNNGSAASGFEYKYEDPYDVNNLTEKRNLAGEFLSSWTYDSNDKAYASSTRDGNGVSIRYPSGDAGNAYVTDDHGVQKTYTIEVVGGIKRLTAVNGDSGCSSCSGDVVRYVYDSNHRVTEVEYTNGRIDRFQDFNNRNQYQTKIQAAGTEAERTIYFTLHPDTGDHLSVSEASVLGDGDKVTIFDYDNDGNNEPNENPTHLMRRKIERGFTRNSAGEVVAYEYITTLDYNAKGQLTMIDGPLPGNQDSISFDYDPVTGDLLSQTLPLSGTIYYGGHDGAGNPGTITDVNNIVTTIDYDGRNRPISVTKNNVTTSVNYTAAGEVDNVIDALSRTLDYVYSPAGLLERITDPNGNYTFTGYNTLGQPIESSIFGADGTKTFTSQTDYGDPAGNSDLLSGKPWKTIRRNHDDTADLETVYAYDGSGNLKAITDANVKTTAYGYDLFDRLEQVTQPGNAVTFYAYDSQGNLASITDAENHTTTYRYDDMGRLVHTDSPDTGINRYAYDEAGNLRYKTQNSKTTEYQYDLQNRLTHIIYADAAQNVTMTYDSGPGANLAGRLATVTDPSGYVEYSYDGDGNVEMETRTVNGVAFVTGYGYDAAGNLRSITYPTGHTIDYQADGDDPALVERVVLDGATPLAANIGYLPFGPVNAMTLGNGIQVSRTYDLNYQLKTMSAGALLDRTYTPDAVGNIEVIADNLDSSRSQSFAYDDLYRLTSASGIYGAIAFTYDKVGNRLTRNRTGPSASQDNYHYMPGTNLLQAVAGSHPELIQYDADGNTKTRTPTAANPVPAITDPADYVYNSGGQRAVKDAASDRIFHYDLAGQLIAETDGAGNLIKAYVWLHGQPLAQFVADGSVFYYHNDHLGTPQRMSDANQNVVWAADYLPFGQADVTVETVGNDLRFAGQYYDSETGLHYNYHRYYDPKLGRYLRADPIGLRGGINLYQYASANPINAIDPLGLTTWYYDETMGSLGSKWGGAPPPKPRPNLARGMGKVVMGSSPGDIFTIGISGGYYLGAGFSLDRIVMPNGEPDWFLTIGGGLSTPGAAFAIDRGKVSNESDALDFCEDDVKGFSLSADLSLGAIGGEWLVSNLTSDKEADELQGIKGGLRTGVGMNFFGNWTYDIGQ